MNANADLKVGVVTSTYAREQSDPQVPWMREQVQRLKKRGVDIEVFAPTYKGLGSHEIDGVKINRFRYGLKSWEQLTHDEGAPNKKKTLAFKLTVLCYLFFGSISIFWWCWRKKIQVLHVHWPFPHGVWSLLPQWLLGVKVMAMSHGAELAIARNSQPVCVVLGWLLRRADVCCANSSHTASEVRRVSGRESVITPYGATVQPRERCVISKESGVPTLLFCGRLIQRKGIHYLLRALPLVLPVQKVQLIITGEGDQKESWMELRDELELQEHVHFAGFVSNEELAELYRTSDLYVHPAIFDDKGDTEGLGVVLIEALAHRMPVVASGVGGIVDVIKDGETGLLVPEKSELALAGAILKILDNEELASRLGEGGFQHVQQFFDWERITTLVEGLYHGLLSGDLPVEEAKDEVSLAEAA